MDVIFAGADPTTLLIGIGLSVLAGWLLKPDDDPLDADKPTTLATRGSRPAWIVGRRLIAPVFCWAGDREIRQEKAEGGKGLGGPEQDVYYETGWHVLTIGTCHALHAIISNGKTIMSGPITPESHPSGSTINLGTEGAFQIYWGEENQPPNAVLADASRIGINSDWPFCCYVFWNKKRMGASPNWPRLQYILERHPSNTLLTQSDPWYEDTPVLNGPFLPFQEVLANADQDVGYFQFNDDVSEHIRASWDIQITGNGIGDGTYEVLRVVQLSLDTGFVNIGGFPIFGSVTRVFVVGGTAGADLLGTIQAYTINFTSGVNIAHAKAEALFAPFPHGAGFDPAHIIETWDLESLEALGVEAETDLWRASILGQNGEKLDALLGNMLQDHMVMLPIDTATGSLTFQRVRAPSGTLLNFQSSVNGGKLPEINNNLGPRPVDRLVFKFKDSQHLYGDMTISIDDDGQAAYEEHSQAREIPITSTVRFGTAANLAELRAPEELTDAAEIKLELSRMARDLVPGDACTIEGFDEVMRVVSVTIDPQSESVEVTVAPDAYGVPKSTFVSEEGGGEVVIVYPAQDEFAWAEVPEQLLGNFPQPVTVVVPRIRANAATYFATLHLSGDDVTYIIDQNTFSTQTGGTLIAELSADALTFEAQSVEYTEEGPDNSTNLQDLSADLLNWGLGRQLGIIVSLAGIEIVFLQRATITGGTTRRLDGLLRARYDTRKLTHPIGARIYIFNPDNIDFVRDPLLVPTEALYVKSQPGTSVGQVNLSGTPAYGESVAGKGQVPIAPDYVHVRAPIRSVPVWQTGDDITLSWALSTGTASTGAGGQPAGNVIAAPTIPGSVEIELLTTGDVSTATIVLDANTLEYVLTNAALVAAFTGEPGAFKVIVTHIANGYSSDPSPALTLTQI